MAENQAKDSLQQSKEDLNELVKHKTANYTINSKTEDLWATFDNLGSTKAVVFQLPPAVIGDGFKFVCAEAQAVKMAAAVGEVLEHPDGVSGDLLTTQYVYQNGVGSRITWECETTGKWTPKNRTGGYGILTINWR